MSMLQMHIAFTLFFFLIVSFYKNEKKISNNKEIHLTDQTANNRDNISFTDEVNKDSEGIQEEHQIQNKSDPIDRTE